MSNEQELNVPPEVWKDANLIMLNALVQELLVHASSGHVEVLQNIMTKAHARIPTNEASELVARKLLVHTQEGLANQIRPQFREGGGFQQFVK